MSGEERLIGRGVSYCATCDGALYRGKRTAVVGGGNTALEDALFLSNLCESVVLIHRRSEFRGEESLLRAVRERTNIEILTPFQVTSLEGEERLKEAVLTRRGRSTGGTPVWNWRGFLSRSDTSRTILWPPAGCHWMLTDISAWGRTALPRFPVFLRRGTTGVSRSARL